MGSGIRILHVIPSVGPLRGGPSGAMRVMARGLGRAKLEVHVATTDDNERARLDVPLGVPLVEDGVTYWYFRRQTRFYTFSWPLARWLAVHIGDYDIVHIHALFSWSTVAAAWYATRRGVPYVIRPLGTLSRWGLTHRRPLLKRLSLLLLDRRILAGAARIHYTSEQERLEGARFESGDQGTVVPLGVDLPGLDHLRGGGWLKRRAPQFAGRRVVLFLSRLDAKKGLDLLLLAFSRLRGDETRPALVVAGSGSPDFELSLRRRAARLGLQDDDVLWAGFLDGQEKLSMLAEADVFVLPSYAENFGVAAVEAMASAVPVIISDQVAISHQVATAGAGLIVPCEAEALADAIRQLVGNEGLRRNAGDCGRRLAHERFSLDAMTTGLMQMYEEVLRNERRVEVARDSDGPQKVLQ